MHLAIDTVYPAPRGGSCRVRIYPPDSEGGQPVVIVSELPGNEGMSVTDGADRIAAEVMDEYGLPVPFVFIEHYPTEAHPPKPATCDLVTFSDYGVRKEAPDYRGEGPVRRVGRPSWSPLDHATVEGIVGQEVR